MSVHSNWVTVASLLIGLSVTALLTSNCTEVEGPLPLRTEKSRVSQERDDVTERGRMVEIRAPKGNATLTLNATCVAGTPDSRTVIEPDSNGAAVLWEPGDQIKVQYLKDDKLYYGVFVTHQGGSSSAVFTTEDDILGGSDYMFLAPGYTTYSERASYSGARVFGINIPTAQTAVEGGVMADSNIGFAQSASFSDGMSLTFSNLPSILRFRLSGSLAGLVKSIALRTTTGIAGVQSIFSDGGVPTYYPAWISGTEIFTSLNLSGDFEAGKEYHIVLWPYDLPYFEMEFSDGEGNYTTLRSTKKISLHQSEIVDLGTIDLGDTWRYSGDISMDPVKYLSATEGSKPVTIAVLPDGFKKSEIPLFESLAKEALDYIFDTEPYKTYKNRFNAWILKVASNESGGGVTNGSGTIVTPVDNYFGSRWGSPNYTDFVSDYTKIINFTGSNCPDVINGIHTSKEVTSLVIVNDTRYGGKAKMYQDGSGCAVSPWIRGGGLLWWSLGSVLPNNNTASSGYHTITADEYAQYKKFPGDWRSVALHEFSHAFGRLTDEYWNYTSAPKTAKITELTTWQNYAVPHGLNVSTSYTKTPWDELLNRRDELIQRDARYSRIGKFQGGQYYLFKFWRSEMVSCMLDHRQYFNAWSRYLIAKRIMTLSGDGGEFNFNYWMLHDDPTDPLRDNLGTRSGDLDRSDRYQYIYPAEPEYFFPPDAPAEVGDDTPGYQYVKVD